MPWGTEAINTKYPFLTLSGKQAGSSYVGSPPYPSPFKASSWVKEAISESDVKKDLAPPVN